MNYTKIQLRSFTCDDIPLLRRYGFEQYSTEQLKETIEGWNSRPYQGRYFEMFAIDMGGEVVGHASLYQRSQSIVSCGLEVYPEHQRKGCATEAYKLLLKTAKEKGFQIAVAQVRADNTASLALNRKLGFEAEDYEYINKKGDKVYYFIKAL